MKMRKACNRSEESDESYRKVVGYVGGRLAYLNKVTNTTRLEALEQWQATTLSEKIAADMYWQFGYSGYSTGRNHDDGLTIYLDEDEAQPLVYEHAAAVNAASGGGGGGGDGDGDQTATIPLPPSETTLVNA